jgi:transposase
MGEVSTIGLDIAKSVFQVHGVDVAGSVVIRKRIGRAKMLEYFGGLPRCLVGIEACPSALLGPRAASAWPPGQTGTAELCEGLPQTQQE